jgi:hypothetical protein
MSESFDFSRLCTPAEYANLRDVDRKTVYNWINAGKAPPHEIICGRVYLYKPGQEP